MLSSTESDDMGGIIMVSLEDEEILTYSCGFVCHRNGQQRDDLAAVLIRLSVTKYQRNPGYRHGGWEERVLADQVISMAECIVVLAAKELKGFTPNSVATFLNGGGSRS